MEDTYGRKIRVFWANMYLHGVQILPDEQGTGLVVNRRKEIKLSPVVQDEIRQRAALLLDMLTPAPPAELRQYFYRTLCVEEVNKAFDVAAACNVALRSVNVGPGIWLIEIAKE